MRIKRTGLTLGKFAPLHKGHQYMIETALSEVDELVILIYDAAETEIPLSVRAEWLRRLYPQAVVLEAWDGPQEVGDTPKIRTMHEEYILRRIKGRRITHFYSSEFYGEHVSRRLGAINRQVDPGRTVFPVSGTLVREDPFKWRDYVHPLVYRDLITGVVFLGAPSTGKSTLAEALARKYGTVCMPEYGREYWEAHQVDRRLTPEQLVEIARGHLEREERLLTSANRYLFVDTNAITTYMFSLDYHGFALPELEELARMAASRYDLVFLCADDIPYDDTWDRSGEVKRAVFQKRIIADLKQRRIPYIELRGNLDERIATVERVLARFRKYDSLGEWALRGIEGRM
ncbi:AAA family ATPase [Staphylospora marina]|uniref:AAA family ATPase n=1 Tax=Staphylospora marina TaxID=2490858 RepID=UPI000F5BFEF7|nr:AAA family ATPase [Staphylospora marina]